MVKTKNIKGPKGETDDDDVINAISNSLIAELGDGAAAPLSSPDTLSKITSWVSTRSIVVDAVLAGGRPKPCSLLPFGRQIEISGLPGSGKTTLCAQIAAEVQAQGGIVVVTDTEERIDVPYWTQLGVDCDKVIRLEAHTLEEVFNKQEAAIRIMAQKASDRKCLIIWDSLGGTSSDEILEFDPKKKETFMEKAKQAFGRDAKTIGLGLKGLNGLIASTNTCYLYTNHLYTKMETGGYGEQTDTYGGLKAKFMATVRLRLTKVGNITEETVSGKNIIGNKVRVKALKNSMSPMQMEKEAVLMGGLGFSNEYTVFELGKKLGVVKTAGAWSTADFGGEEIKFQGWSGFQEKVVTHPKYAELLDSVYKAL